MWCETLCVLGLECDCINVFCENFCVNVIVYICVYMYMHVYMLCIYECKDVCDFMRMCVSVRECVCLQIHLNIPETFRCMFAS